MLRLTVSEGLKDAMERPYSCQTWNSLHEQQAEAREVVAYSSDGARLQARLSLQLQYSYLSIVVHKSLERALSTFLELKAFRGDIFQ